MKDLKRNIKFAWKYISSQKIRLLLFLICNILQIIISVVTPILSAKIIVSLTNDYLIQVVFIAFIIFIVEILRNTFYYLSFYYSQISYREIFTSIQLDLGKTILKLTNKTLDDNSSGVFIQRLTGDVSNIADIFNVVSYELSDVVTNIGIFGAILIIDYRVFIYVLFMIVIIGIFENKRVKYCNKKEKEFRKENEKVSGFVGELVRGARDIKMLNASRSFISELDTKLKSVNKSRYDITVVRRNYMYFTGFLKDLFDFLLIVLLVYFIVNQELTIALALVVYNYSKSVIYIINSYSYLIENVKKFNLSTSRILEIINSNKFPKEKFGNTKLDNIKGYFEFKNVNFSYQENIPVLKDLSFKVDAYSTVSFVGKSGSGKTTIFNLLCKMYDIDSGSILIDGVNINELDKNSIRDNITIISQNPYIFNLSIRDNLRLVKRNLSEKEMKEVCRLACLDDFIESLPKKYDTIVGEGGVSLSGGERQRLAIARALLQKSRIILFDEATSALDNVTQKKIQDAIDNLQGDYTILIIAHRLSTIVNSDKILYLEDGNVKASGKHEDLLAKCEGYQKLYSSSIKKE